MPDVANSSRRTDARAPRQRVDGPDFLCVGLMKSGTMWLYDQLQHHPDFWMTPYKELHYFDRAFPGRKILGTTAAFHDAPDDYAADRADRHKRGLDERDTAFFRQIAEFSARRGDLDAYASLFAPKGDLLSGDITPAYCTLGGWTIRRLSRRFPQTRVLLLLREPAARLWSQWRDYVERRSETGDEALDVKAFRSFARKSDVRQRSYPSVIAKRWRKRFGDRMHWLFLDDVIARPEETRQGILRLLGADENASAVLPADFNRKARKRSLERSLEIQDTMRALFAKERAICAEMFGGAARKWPDAPY